MPRSTSKVVLYTITGAGATMSRVPIAVFNDANSCRPYAVSAMTAYKAGDVESVKAIGLPHLVNAEGELKEGLRFQRIELPYSPEAVAPDLDPFAGEPQSTT